MFVSGRDLRYLPLQNYEINLNNLRKQAICSIFTQRKRIACSHKKQNDDATI